MRYIYMKGAPRRAPQASSALKELELRVHRSIANHIDDTMDIKTEGGEGAVTLLREKRFADLRCGGGVSLALTISGRVGIV